MRSITNYGLIGPTTNGRVKWLQTPEAVAQAWLHDEYPMSRLRVLVDGRIGHGTAEESQLVYDALRRLEEQS
jgi:hypothetical protein